MPHFTPENPYQEVANQVAKSVGRLSSCEAGGHIIPVLILDKGNDSYCLLFESSIFKWEEAQASILELPQNQAVQLPDRADYETEFDIHECTATFATLSFKGSLHYPALEFGQDVTRNQVLYLFDFRFGNPYADRGNVTFVDDMHFMIDAKPSDHYLEGGLVFDKAMRLVGVIYDHAGSPKAIKISYLRRKLAGKMPQSIRHGGGAGGSGAGSSSSSG